MLFRLRSLLILPLIFASVCTNAQQNFADSELKDAIPRPQARFVFGVQVYNAADEYTLLDDNEGRRAAIAALRDKLKRQPNNAALWITLGKHYERLEQREPAHSTYAEAVRLLHGQIKNGAKLPRVERAKRMALLGNALEEWREGKQTEAEKWLRMAVKTAPKEWSVWNDLAIFLPKTYGSKLYPNLEPTLWRNSKDFRDFRRKLPQPTMANKTAAARLKTEAFRAADTAIRLAPTRSEPYRTRADMRSHFAFNEAMYLDPHKEFFNTAPSAIQLMLASWEQPEGRRDMRLAFRHATTAFDIAYPALCEWIAEFIKAGIKEREKNNAEDPGAIFMGLLWQKYPADTRKTITDAVARLEKIAATKPQERPLALAVGGILQIQMGQQQTALNKMHAALKLRSGYSAVRELVMGAAAYGRDFAEGETILKEILVHDTTPRRYLAMAHYYNRHGKSDQEGQQLAETRKRFPKDGTVLLWTAADIMSEYLKEKLADVTVLLDEADKELDMDDDHRPVYEMLRGVEAYLGGKLADGIARIKAVAAAEPNNQWAATLLELFTRE